MFGGQVQMTSRIAASNRGGLRRRGRRCLPADDARAGGRHERRDQIISLAVRRLRQPGGRTFGLAWRTITGWELWLLPRRLRAQICGVVGAYTAALIAAAWEARLTVPDLLLWGVLLACTAATVEVTRRVGEPGGQSREMYGIWELPAAVLLPPVFVMLMTVPRHVQTMLRVRRGVPHRRVFTAASVGLSYGIASWAFHAAEGACGFRVGGSAWVLLVLATGITRLATNDALILTAVRAAQPGFRILPAAIGREALANDAAELAAGVLVACAVRGDLLATACALPLVISMQRSIVHSQLVEQARTDPKTGLLNDATWRHGAARELRRAVRTGTPVAVLLLDIDHFKRFNDSYGHLAGDAVLQSVAAGTRALLREYDLVGRVGGEEFAVLLPATTVLEAIEAAERIRCRMPGIAAVPAGAAAAVPGTAAGAPQAVTVSVGVAAAASPHCGLDEFYATADSAMYAAKQGGRDQIRVIIAGDSERLEPLTIADARSRAIRET